MKTHYEHHPACEMLPEMSSDDYERLKSSIKTDGLKDPIVLIGELLLDGRHRLKACEELGVTPKTVQLNDIAPGSNPYTFIFQQHLARRHLSRDQIVAICCKYQMTIKRGTDVNSSKEAFLTKPSEITPKRSPGRPPGMQREAENLVKVSKESLYLSRLAVKVFHHQSKLLDDVIAGLLTLNQAYKKLKPSPPKPVKEENTSIAQARSYQDFQPANYMPEQPRTDEMNIARTYVATFDIFCRYEAPKLTAAERQAVAVKIEEICAQLRRGQQNVNG